MKSGVSKVRVAGPQVRVGTLEIDHLQAICDARHLDFGAVIRCLIEWLTAQDAYLQGLILHCDDTGEAARRVLEKLAKPTE